MTKRSPSNRKKAERFGRWGEQLAALYLRLNFYRLRAHRVKTPVGEIDLIAEHFGTIVFVEVKVRAHAALEGEALQAVNQRRIIRAAEFYLARNTALAHRTLRFDVIFLAPWTWPRHVKDAFSSSE